MATETAVINYLRASRPTFCNAHDKIAFAVHAAFFTAGYILIATGPKALPGNSLTANRLKQTLWQALWQALESSKISDDEEVGLDGWNELEDAYAFVYTKTVTGVKKAVVAKCLSVGNELAVYVLDLKATEEELREPLHVQINIMNHLVDGGDGPVNYREMYKDLTRLVDTLNVEVFSKLEPVENAGVLRHPVGRLDMAEACLLDRNLGILVEFQVYHQVLGPPDVPGFEPGRFVRQPSRRPGGGTHPDLENFQGPNYF